MATSTPPSGDLKQTGTLEIKDSRTDKSYSVQIIQGGVEGDTRAPRHLVDQLEDALSAQTR